MRKALLMLLAAAALTLAACDPGVTVRLTRHGSDTIACPDRQNMVYFVNIEYSDSGGKVERHRFDQYSWEGVVSAVDVPSTYARLKWIQFEVYCGDDEEPYIVTRRIRPEELTTVPGTRGLDHTFELEGAEAD